MQLALEEAKKAYKKGEVPIGAIVVRKDEVVATGHNLRESLKDATAHAEIISIQKACKKAGGWRLTESVLYVTIEPCPMCAGAILQSRIDRVVIGAMDPKAGACGSVINLFNQGHFNHKVEITTGVLEEECSSIMKAFFKTLRDSKRNNNK
ncbi:tRNA-adenosine deaminase [Natronincola peptidivorans]|uniref:tRNA-specific adenosine deaminase n=2 Tax=Natronincola peptidivorans TaxID=426128 RepID=A0A1I0GY45_9FIRM|nr:tRNA-adenosine deaminase [Natronincola peptidivorans]